MATLGQPPLTPDDDEDWDEGRLHARVVTYIGHFASAQGMIDTAVRVFLLHKLQEFGPTVIKAAGLDRLQDDARLKLFTELAKTVSYSGDLTKLRAIYQRAAQVRNLLSHSVHVGVGHDAKGRMAILCARFPDTKIDKVPDPLLPSTLERLVVDCAWLTAHAIRCLSEAMPGSMTGMDDVPYEPELPPSVPVGGEPLPPPPPKKTNRRDRRLAQFPKPV